MSRFLPKRPEPFGKAGLTVAIVALVMAMAGGAYAAGGLTKSQEKQVTKIAKKYAGKPGATGPAGTPGTNGTNGKDGAAGKDGVSVTTKAIPNSSETCKKQGGTEFTSASGTEKVCNGQTGFTTTLPSGKTLKGDWALTGNPPAAGFPGGTLFTSVSFGIPLAAAPTVVYVKEGETTPAGCTGSVEEPGAEAGKLCIFAKLEHNNTAVPSICASAKFSAIQCAFGVEQGSDPFGFLMVANATAAEPVYLNGTWAVTAE